MVRRLISGRICSQPHCGKSVLWICSALTNLQPENWVDEYGDPAKEKDFRNLLAYPPYHNIKPGKDYPAILATTADSDDRVVPAHTFNYVAALQATDIGHKPHLVRIETHAQAMERASLPTRSSRKRQTYGLLPPIGQGSR